MMLNELNFVETSDFLILSFCPDTILYYGVVKPCQLYWLASYVGPLGQDIDNPT
jgi:hypothetical protein